MKIGVVGLGYVGSSIAALFSKKYLVNIYDRDQRKSDLLINGLSPVNDKFAEKDIQKRKNNFIQSEDIDECSKNSDIIFLCVPTDLNNEKNGLETKNIKECIFKARKANRDNLIIVKSTIPYGFLPNLLSNVKLNNVFYVPEFLRESDAYKDTINPTRIVIGCQEGEKHSAILIEKTFKSVLEKDVSFFVANYREAAAIKLFSNTFLAMRVAFFNELDTYASINKLDSKTIITGVCCDPRIGNYYNNPSFAYGGYCLPKDTIELESESKDLALKLIPSITKSNEERLNKIISDISKLTLSQTDKSKCKIGFYRLIAKHNSHSIRNSQTLSIIKKINSNKNVEIKIYEPLLKSKSLDGNTIENDLKVFKQWADIIIANRITEDIEDVLYKVYSRDIFHKD